MHCGITVAPPLLIVQTSKHLNNFCLFDRNNKKSIYLSPYENIEEQFIREKEGKDREKQEMGDVIRRVRTHGDRTNVSVGMGIRWVTTTTLVQVIKFYIQSAKKTFLSSNY